jgi:anti-anti-sigma factor
MKPTQNRLTRESLEMFLDSVALRPGIQLVLDLDDVHSFASATLASLISLQKRAKAVGGQLTIRHVRPEVMNAFQITRLDHVFEFES